MIEKANVRIGVVLLAAFVVFGAACASPERTPREYPSIVPEPPPENLPEY